MGALLTIVPSQRALFDWRHHHADASHTLLTFKTSITMPTPNLCIVAKTVHHMLSADNHVYFIQRERKIPQICIEALRYNKTKRDWCLHHY